MLSRGLHQPLPCKNCCRLGGNGARGPGVRPPLSPPVPPPPGAADGAKCPSGRAGAAPLLEPQPRGAGFHSGLLPGAGRRRRGCSPRQRERGAGAGGAVGRGALAAPAGGLRRGSSPGGGQPSSRVREGRDEAHRPCLGLPHTGAGNQRRGRSRGCAGDRPGHPRRCVCPMCRLRTPCPQGNAGNSAVSLS